MHITCVPLSYPPATSPTTKLPLGVPSITTMNTDRSAILQHTSSHNHQAVHADKPQQKTDLVVHTVSFNVPKRQGNFGLLTQRKMSLPTSLPASPPASSAGTSRQKMKLVKL